jgi:hypothetical protein
MNEILTISGTWPVMSGEPEGLSTELRGQTAVLPRSGTWVAASRPPYRKIVVDAM